MAGKFTIFRDECDSAVGSQQLHPHQLQPLKQQPDQNTVAEEKSLPTLNQHSERDTQPLKREPLGLRHTKLEQHFQPKAPLSEAPSTSSTSISEENQENDISMASLGSEYVPVVDDTSFDDQSFEADEGSAMLDSLDYADEIDYEADFNYDDEELKMELSQAFKEHDDSQLFKSTVYIDDIRTYLHRLERQPNLRPLPNYMDHQLDIDSEKRSILINWLVEVSEEYDLQSETLFICIGIMDRFLSAMSIPTSNFQLLGVAAMFIASKYEEIYPPNLYTFVEVTDESYSGKQIRQMEQEILKTLNFQISLPTISYFLREIFAFNKFTKKIYNMAEYLCYLSLSADQPFLEYYPSEIAIAAVILAVTQIEPTREIPRELLAAYEKSNIDQLHRRSLPRKEIGKIDRRAYIVFEDLPFCIESLRALQERTFNDFTSKRLSQVSSFSAVFHKFSSETNNRVALMQPLKAKELHAY